MFLTLRQQLKAVSWGCSDVMSEHVWGVNVSLPGPWLMTSPSPPGSLSGVQRGGGALREAVASQTVSTLPVEDWEWISKPREKLFSLFPIWINSPLLTPTHWCCLNIPRFPDKGTMRLFIRRLFLYNCEKRRRAAVIRVMTTPLKTQQECF